MVPLKEVREFIILVVCNEFINVSASDETCDTLHQEMTELGPKSMIISPLLS